VSQSWSLARVLIYVVRATRNASVIRMGCTRVSKNCHEDNEISWQLKLLLKTLTRGRSYKNQRCRVCRVKTKVLQKKLIKNFCIHPTSVTPPITLRNPYRYYNREYYSELSWGHNSEQLTVRH
jgi:hypothetical protein